MTAMPPDEVSNLTPATTLRCERLGGIIRSAGAGGGVGEGREIYTNVHAAEFMRRGACMVVWPGVEGEEDGNEDVWREEGRFGA